MIKLNNGRIILLNGDCLQEMKRIKPNSIDMVFADLPYGSTALTWDKHIDIIEYWKRINIVRKLSTPIVMTAVQPFTSLLINSNLTLYKYNWIWYKNASTGFAIANRQPMRCYEDVCIFYEQQCLYNKQLTRSKSNRKFGGKNGTRSNTGNHVDMVPEYQITLKEFVNPRNVLEISIEPMALGRLHETQKPVELLEYMILTYTNPGDTVLDPVFGSGTTGVVCAKLNRRFIGIEKDPSIFERGANRIAQAVKNHDQVAA